MLQLSHKHSLSPTLLLEHRLPRPGGKVIGLSGRRQNHRIRASFSLALARGISSSKPWVPSVLILDSLLSHVPPCCRNASEGAEPFGVALVQKMTLPGARLSPSPLLRGRGHNAFAWPPLSLVLAAEFSPQPRFSRLERDAPPR